MKLAVTRHLIALLATLDGTELVAATAAHVLETVLRAVTRLFTTSLDQLRMTALLVEWAST